MKMKTRRKKMRMRRRTKKREMIMRRTRKKKREMRRTRRKKRMSACNEELILLAKLLATQSELIWIITVSSVIKLTFVRNSELIS